MRSLKTTSKRLLGLTVAAALAVSGVVTLASQSEAATLTYTVLPKTGPQYVSAVSSSTQVLAVTGKGFQAGTSVKVGGVNFSTSACGATYSTTGAASSYSVVSATKLVVTPTSTGLPPSSSTAASTDYNLCVYDLTGGSAGSTSNKLVGSAKYTVYPVATITSVNAATTGAVTGSSTGGDTITVVGTNFTKASYVTIDGVALKSTFIDDTSLTAVTVAHVPGTGKKLAVVTEGGAKTATPTISFLDTLKISPTYGDGTAGNVLSITGTGFSARTFVSTTTGATTSAIVINVASQTPTTSTAVASAIGANGFYCGTIQVESDTELSCQVPAIAPATKSGGYTVQIVDGGATNLSAVTAVSRSATYTVSAF